MVDRLVNSEANARRIKHVEDCFGSSGEPLVKQGRVLVGEGVLTKICRKKPKPRQFFLFNDVLAYGNIVINKKKYNKQHILPHEELKIVPLEDEEHLRNGWQIISPSKSFAVYAATGTEKSEWMAHINKCITDQINKTGKKSSKEHAAVWVPDHDANICMHCNKSKFTAINRRHHCRRCGLVVCGTCSTRKFLLPYISSKPIRVCNTCFDKLSDGRMKATDPLHSEEKPAGRPDGADIATVLNTSLTRKESDSIAESGSSEEDQSDDEDGNGEMTSKPTFYEGDKVGESNETTEYQNITNNGVPMEQ